MAMKKDSKAILASLGLYLNEPEPAIICSSCKYALQPSADGVSRHLAEKHQVSKGQRRDLTSLIKSLCLPDPNKLPIREDGLEPHPELSLQAGVACKVCGVRSTSLEVLTRHLSKSHGIKGNKGGWIHEHIDQRVVLQSWTQAGRRSYWTVVPAVEGLDQDQSRLSATPRRKRQVDKLIQEERDRLASKEGLPSTNDVGSDELSLTSNWMRRTNWLQTFRGADRLILRRLTLRPLAGAQTIALGAAGGQEITSSSNTEQRLHLISIALDRLFDRCEDTVQHTDRPVLCWLRSNSSQRPYKAPFLMSARKSTSNRYRSLFKRLFFLSSRLYCLPREIRDKILGFSLKPELLSAIALLWHDAWWETNLSTGWIDRQDTCNYSTKDAVDIEEDDDVSEHDTESSQCSASEDEAHQPLYNLRITRDSFAQCKTSSTTQPTGCRSDCLDELADKVGVLATYLCTEHFTQESPASSLLVYFSGILGFTPDGTTFLHARAYTPYLSALAYCIRLIVFESTLPRFAHPHAGWAARPPIGHTEIIKNLHERYLSNVCQAPMGELLSLRSYGRAISRTDGPRFRVRWSADGQLVSWPGGRTTLHEFRSLAKKLLDDISEKCNELMFGLRNQVKLDQIYDEMSKSSAGYSFVSDAANKLQDAYLLLMNHACLGPIGGLMSSDRWNTRAVDGYLRKIADFLNLLSIAMHVLGGQSARGTEFLSVEHENGPASLRGIFVHDGSMIYITRHYKARRATNNEFQVVRFLPREIGEALFRYLVYIRPFADSIRRRCHGQVISSRLLFYNHNSEHGLWTSAQLSKNLHQYTDGILSTALGIQTYRQVSIAITERHIQALNGPINRLDDRSREAVDSVAFAWQSGHRPQQRVTNYGIDGAYPDTLQPALLRVYRWASEKWHEFLCVDVQERTQSLRLPHSHEESSTPSSMLLSTGAKKRNGSAIDMSSPCSSKRLRLESNDRGDCHTVAERRSPRRRGQDSSWVNPINFSMQSNEVCDQQISYLADYKVVVCLPCGHCIVPPPGAKRHFKDRHSALPLATRNELVRCIDKLCLVAPGNVNFPKQPVQAIKGLSVYDGWSCYCCVFLCTSELTMQEHARTSHGWIKGHGRKWRAAQVQTFFSGDKRRFFEVTSGTL